MWLGGEFGVVITWEMLLKNFEEKKKKEKKGKGKGKEKRKDPLTFYLSVFFFSMDTDEYSKVYSEVSSFFSLLLSSPFFFSFFCFLLVFFFPLTLNRNLEYRLERI